MCEKCEKVWKVWKSAISWKNIENIYIYCTWSDVPKIMIFLQNTRKYFSRKLHFRKIIAFPIGNQWFWRSFPHFSHFREKVRKVAPFWPKSKNSEKRCRFYHVFGPFPHFCEKVGGELILARRSWGTQTDSGTRTSPPRGAAGSPMGSPRPRTTHARTGVSCNRSRSGGPDRAEHSLPPSLQ